METLTPNKAIARFDTRITLEQKQLLEKAASMGGFRSLSDFVLNAAQEKANQIIRENEQIITSVRDGFVFYEAITKPAEPNEALRKAAENYGLKINN